jgi:serine/threonine protein kinase
VKPRTNADPPRRRVTLPGLHRDLRGDDLVTTRGSSVGASQHAGAASHGLILPDHLFRAGRARSPHERWAENPVLPPELFARVHAPLVDPPPRARPAPATPRREYPERDPELPEIGAILDKYRIEELIGMGGFAAVYRATHLMLRMPVAIKMLRPSVMRRRPGLAASLCEEARFAAKIDHPNVVRVFDVTHLPKITYIVMEYIDGSTLAKLVQRERQLPLRTIVQIGLDVTRGLDAGLDRGLVHRDIKPENIMITKNQSAKIVDLGLAHAHAHAHDDAHGLPDPSDDRVARSAMVGTHGYMPPDWAASRAGDFRADIYALGVTLYHAAVGKPPFPTDDPERCIRLHREAPVPAPEHERPDLPPKLCKLLLDMLAKKAADRPQSYGAISDVLEDLVTDLTRAELDRRSR